jgi:hypothetical protein
MPTIGNNAVSIGNRCVKGHDKNYGKCKKINGNYANDCGNSRNKSFGQPVAARWYPPLHPEPPVWKLMLQ